MAFFPAIFKNKKGIAMARRRKNTFNKKVIDALLFTPFIVLGPNKRTRRSAAKKWLGVIKQATK